MSTRAATAITLQQVKDKLIRLLFGPTTTTSSSPPSYQVLKRAYLNKIQILHPDKSAHVVNKVSPSSQQKRTHAAFVELQEAWTSYNDLSFKQCNNKKEEEEGNFTMFGVGCSFSDSPKEREHRNEIMDQASRGWFSSGLLIDNPNNSNSQSDLPDNTKVLTSRLFTNSDDENDDWTTTKTEQSKHPPPYKKSLVDYLFPKGKRKA